MLAAAAAVHVRARGRGGEGAEVEGQGSGQGSGGGPGGVPPPQSVQHLHTRGGDHQGQIRNPVGLNAIVSSQKGS